MTHFRVVTRINPEQEVSIQEEYDKGYDLVERVVVEETTMLGITVEGLIPKVCIVGSTEEVTISLRVRVVRMQVNGMNVIGVPVGPV